MRYFGGKARLAKDIAKVINSFNANSYHEPFCGMFSVGSLVTSPKRSGSDLQEDLILLLKAVQTGWIGPEFVSEEEYQQLKIMPPSPLRGFVGFGCSNSGKFFGGYARESGNRNFAKNARSSLLKLAPKIQNVEFTIQSYLDFNQTVDLIYCDPPYRGTTDFSTGHFDNQMFWDWVKLQSRRSIVIVSEYTAPDWVECIWEKSVKTDMNARLGGKLSRIEKLFAVGL